ncbi:MAG: hypothetical protein QNJ36_11390 [Calothrix sp. MO_167.B42]|nr:hypothetical protein [Calothrix sp. MO_167.B42]
METVFSTVRGKEIMGEKLLLAIALTFAISLFSNASLSSSQTSSRNMAWEGLPMFQLILKN